MKVSFVGAGPGNPDYLTVKARRILQECRIIIYAGSLVSPGVMDLVPEKAERYDSAAMDLEEITAVFLDARDRNIDAVRLHSGDPSIYGATREQMNELDRHGISYEVVPGISAFQAAAAALATELTAPEVSQAVILARTSGRTPLPEEQELSELARPRATLCIYLSGKKIKTVMKTLIPHYGKDCPAAVVYHASWPDEKVVRGALADIAARVDAAQLGQTSIILVGRALSRDIPASKLYDARFSHGFRTGKDRKKRQRNAEMLHTIGCGTEEEKRNMKTALITLSNEGARIIREIAAGFAGADLFIHEIVTVDIDGASRFTSITELTALLFNTHRNIVYVVPCGIAVRAIAPLLKTKHTDPAIIVVDVGKRFVISLLSGHEGGANDLAIKTSNLIGAEPVITTTKEASKTLIVGIGCRRGAASEVIIEAIRKALDRVGATSDEVRLLASADIKANEVGLLAASESMGIPIRFIPSAEIREAKRVFARSDLAQKKVGLPAVAEPAALIVGKRTKLILKRIIWKGVTVAIARENSL